VQLGSCGFRQLDGRRTRLGESGMSDKHREGSSVGVAAKVLTHNGRPRPSGLYFRGFPVDSVQEAA
jgi:hypothetical protein